jgi:hypothetical protein
MLWTADIDLVGSVCDRKGDLRAPRHAFWGTIMSNPFDLLVEVFAAASETAESCGFGTGYPVARSRIITAGHFLNHGSGYVKVRLKQSNLGDALIPVDGVTWDGRSDGFDVAILACSKLPADLFWEIPLLETMPIADTAANGMGYPLKSHTQDQSRPASISGKIKPMPSRYNDYELGCDDRMGNDRYQWTPEHWKGVSGSPIFVDGKLAGVIKTHEDTNVFDHFRVTAICRLLGCPKFLEAIGWRDSRDEAYRRKTEAGIKARLKKLSGQVEDDYEDRTILDWLLQKLGLSVPRMPDDNKWEVAATFLTQPREETLPQLIEMHLRLCDLNQKENASTLGAVIDMVTPLQFPPDLWRKVREQIAAGGPLVRGAAAGIVTAETVATRIDASEKPGSVKLTKGSAGGLTSPHLMLPTSFKPDEGPLGNPGSELERFVRELYASTRSDISLSFDLMVYQLRGDYKAHKGIHHRSPFVLVSMPRRPEDQEAWLRVLAEVKKWLEHVILIELSDSSEAHTLEGILFKCLNTRLASEKKWDRT